MFRKLVSTCLVVLLLLGLAMVFPTFGQGGTEVKVINSTPGGLPGYFGTTTFNFTNEYPPPTESGYPLGYILANITVTDVTDLGGWQLNLTWDPTLLELATPDDIYRPSDAIFGATGIEIEKEIEAGKVYWGASRGIGQPTFTGSGLLCQIKFNITKEPSIGDTPLTCALNLDRVSAFPTKLTDGAGVEITGVTYTSGLYEYHYVYFLPKPWLEVYPHEVKQGWPLGASIIGTAKENFTISILINDIVSDAGLIAYQFRFIWNKTSGFEYLEAAEGPFLKNPAWAPYGTFWSTTGEGSNTTHSWFVVVAVIWPNATTHKWDWDVWPDSTGLSPEERTLCTITFKSTIQEQYPWEIYTPNAFVLDYVWPENPERTFENRFEEWITAKPRSDWIMGDYHIYGWVTGRMIDVYTQYPDPYGGQGQNMPSDMFWPQKEVKLYANVTYNLWPVQNKLVTFEVRNPAGEIVTVLTDVTDENGVANTSYRIPWPCDNPEELFGVWEVVASVDIACEIVNDTLWFHFDYLVRWIKVTVEPESVAHCENVTITVDFKSHAMQEYNVTITVVIHDELNFPIGYTMILTAVSGAEWCQYKNYQVTVSLHIPKHAAAGIATVHVNALSDLPSNGGCAWVPEYSPPPQFDIRAE